MRNKQLERAAIAATILAAGLDTDARHVDGLAALYAEDAVNHQVVTDPLHGREAIAALLLLTPGVRAQDLDALDFRGPVTPAAAMCVMC